MVSSRTCANQVSFVAMPAFSPPSISTGAGSEVQREKPALRWSAYVPMHLCSALHGSVVGSLRETLRRRGAWIAMTQTYRAVICSKLGPPCALRIGHLPRSPLPAGSVRVAIAAAGINFPDYLTIQGLYQHRPPLPFVPGVEACGTIAEVAPDVPADAVGRKVIAR